MDKIMENMKKSFFHLVESVKSWGSSSTKDGAFFSAEENDGETNLKVESKVQVLEIRARGATGAKKIDPPRPGTA
ncbi:hypothetical protein CDL12_15360 [Handroanthus impetiginosus]|uniref:Uncharacterized protein n=1 Tax=Handroanthus impetiginosus TaxID=429701 RepID=A0A2G9H3E1_9LAMI|nr:hypothetical protein CDL12_15360 [Handroanthus impetiginosus]